MSAVQAVNWGPGEPNDYNNVEDCVEVKATTGQWNDNRCSTRRNWICGFKRGQGMRCSPEVQ